MGSLAPAVDITNRLLLHTKDAGTVIGKGGSHIKELRESTGCKVSIAEGLMPGSERLVTIVGPPLSINRTVELILDKLETSTPGEAAASALAAAGVVVAAIGASEGGGGMGGGGGAGAAPQRTLKMIVSNFQVGALIGKGGSQVKAIREGSGAGIKVEQAAPGLDRIVTLSGGKAEVVRAHHLVVLRLATVPEDDGRANGGFGSKPYNPPPQAPPPQGPPPQGPGGAKQARYQPPGQPGQAMTMPHVPGGYAQQSPYAPYGAGGGGGGGMHGGGYYPGVGATAAGGGGYAPQQQPNPYAAYAAGGGGGGALPPAIGSGAPAIGSGGGGGGVAGGRAMVGGTGGAPY